MGDDASDAPAVYRSVTLKVMATTWARSAYSFASVAVTLASGFRRRISVTTPLNTTLFRLSRVVGGDPIHSDACADAAESANAATKHRKRPTSTSLPRVSLVLTNDLDRGGSDCERVIDRERDVLTGPTHIPSRRHFPCGIAAVTLNRVVN